MVLIRQLSAHLPHQRPRARTRNTPPKRGLRAGCLILEHSKVNLTRIEIIKPRQLVRLKERGPLGLREQPAMRFLHGIAAMICGMDTVQRIQDGGQFSAKRATAKDLANRHFFFHYNYKSIEPSRRRKNERKRRVARVHVPARYAF